MKTFCLTTMIALLLSGSFGIINAQNVKEKASLYNTEQFSITSKYVQGETYRIQVGLPVNYSSSQKSYPVVYILDGDVYFGMTKGIADMLMLGKEIRDIILVGIEYGQGLDIWTKNRIRDLTASSDTMAYFKVRETGGADNFLKFMQYELIPAINKNYRILADSTAIIGHSLGGYFNSYILFKQPELFKNYIIIAPSLGYNNQSILKLESEYYRNHKELNCNVYMCYGSMDNLVSKEYTIVPTNEMIQNIQAHNYKGLRLVTKVFEGDTHFSVPSVAITNGLKALFKP